MAVLIPTHNEQEGIGPTLQEIRRIFGDVSCLVVDRSTDATPQIAEKLGAKVVPQNSTGKGRAVARGLKELEGNARFIALIDGDYTYPAESLKKFARILDQDPMVGMVTGNRYSGSVDPRVQGRAFQLGNRVIALVNNLASRERIVDPLTGLRLLKAEVFKGWVPNSKGFEIEAEMNRYVISKGYRIAEVPIPYRARLGKKKLSLLDAVPIIAHMLAYKLR